MLANALFNLFISLRVLFWVILFLNDIYIFENISREGCIWQRVSAEINEIFNWFKLINYN